MNKNHFRTDFSESIFLHKYKHEGAETWPELSKTLIEDVCGGILPQNEIDELIQYHTDMKFIAGGRYLYYAGRENKYFNNCFLLKSLEDSREDWANLSWKAESCLATGGGIGNDYSIYRKKGAPISKTGGFASGPVSKMKMINEIGREVMQGGSRRCLPEDSLVYTTNGLVKISDIKVGDIVYSENGQNEVLNVFNQGVQSVDKIITNSGYFYGTHNHRMAVLDNEGTIQWKEISKLVEGDILCHFKGSVSGIDTSMPVDFTKDRPKMSTTCGDFNIPELNEDVAWFIGLVHGDGYVYNRNNPRYAQSASNSGSSCVRVACHEDDIETQNKALRVLNLFGVKSNIRAKKNEKCVEIVSHNQRLAEYFERYIKQPKEMLAVPDFILKAKESIKCAYLAGLMDSDGALNNRPVKLITTVYDRFAEEVQNLYASIGIGTRMATATPKDTNWQKKYEVCLIGFRDKYNELISIHSCKGVLPTKNKLHRGFMVPMSIVKKQFRHKDLKNIMSSFNNTKGLNYESFVNQGGIIDFIPVKVLSIENNVKSVNTFDIEVKNDHNFYCNGLLTHNSAIYASLNWKHEDAKEFLYCKDWHSMLVAGAFDENGKQLTIGDLKEADFNFPAPLDMTNISLNYDNKFLEEIYGLSAEQIETLLKVDAPLKVLRLPETFVENVRQALKTGEPGFSFNFFSAENETLRNACTEVTSEDDSDVCNLASINMSRITSEEEMARVTYLAAKFLYCGTFKAKLPYDKVYEVREKNRRLGLGLMGVHEWLLTRGYKYEMNDELASWLRVWKVYSEIGPNELAKQLDANPPVAYRAIAPTGSIGILACTTTGIEPLYAVAYKRRYLKDKKEWHYQYVIDGTAKTLIEDFGVNPDSIETAVDLAKDPERRIKFQAEVQKYVDMSISSTINMPQWGTEFNNEDKVIEFAHTLAKYAHGLRGFTCYPDGSRGGQPLTPVPYHEAVALVGQEFKEEFHDICDIHGKGICGL